MRKHDSQRNDLVVSGAIIMAGLPSTVLTAEPASTNSAPGQMLLNGSLGQLVKVLTNAVPSNLLPPSDIGVENQVPQPARGARVAEPVLGIEIRNCAAFSSRSAQQCSIFGSAVV